MITSVKAGKASDKIQYPFMKKIKNRRKLPQYNKSLNKVEIQTICYDIDEP